MTLDDLKKDVIKAHHEMGDSLKRLIECLDRLNFSLIDEMANKRNKERTPHSRIDAARRECRSRGYRMINPRGTDYFYIIDEDNGRIPSLCQGRMNIGEIEEFLSIHDTTNL